MTSFWLNLTAGGTVDGARATMTTASGQQLAIDTLLPEGAIPRLGQLDNPLDSRAEGDPITHQLIVEAPGAPASTRFLHVLQGADPGETAGKAIMLSSTDGAFGGASVGTTAVLFPVTIGTVPGEIAYTVPADITTHIITGLAPGATFNVALANEGASVAVSLSAGTGYTADAGGVLVIGELPSPLGTSSLAFTRPLVPIVTAPAEAEAGLEVEIARSGDDPPAALSDGLKADPAALVGTGTIVYEATDAAGRRHLYRIAATPGAEPEDLTATFDERGAETAATAIDEAITISPDGKWLALGTTRFHEQCDGWPCVTVMPADLSGTETVLINGEALHPDGWAIVGSGGNLVVYPMPGGPHAQDLWATRRAGGVWSTPVLLTGASSFAFNHTPALSADGTRLVFDCGNEPYAGAGTAICEVATDGTGFRVIVTPEAGPLGSPEAALHHPDYEPDGAIVLQSSWDDGLWRMPAGAAEPQSVGAPNSDSAPCVMADGRIASIWYGNPNGAGTPDVRLTTPNGSTYALLVTGTPVEDITCGG